MNNLSKLQIFRTLPSDEQMKRIMSLTDEEADLLLYDYDWNARPNQIIPQNGWGILILKAGRGFGKTWVGAHWIKREVQTNKYCNLMGSTMNDVIKTMIMGPSGIMSICSKHEKPTFKNGELQWPNGARSLLFSAEEPERLRGPNHMKIWMDEVGSWRYQDSFDQAMFGLRLGKNPQCLITTTPRTTPLFKKLMANPRTLVMHGSTYDNKDNLAQVFLDKMADDYEGTRLGRQELYGELLEENENALWNLTMLDALRVESYNNFSRIVVAIDPAVTNNDSSDNTGIVVCGKGEDGHYYIIEDLTMKGKPSEWATVAVNAYHKYNADRIVAETNNGGDLVEDVIRNVDRNVSYKKVTATRGKILRAEPIAALYEQKKVHHIGLGVNVSKLKKLEEQMCNFTGTDLKQKSPDRLDALVWGLTELSESKNGGFLDYIDQEKARLKEEKNQQNKGW